MVLIRLSMVTQNDYELEQRKIYFIQDYIAKLARLKDFPLLAADKKTARVSSVSWTEKKVELVGPLLEWTTSYIEN